MGSTMVSDRSGACYGQRPKWSLLWPATEVELAMASDRSGANPLTHQSAFPVSGCKVTLFSSYRHHLSVFLMGKRVPAYEAGTLGRDGVRWLLHLVEGAGVVALASVHHS